MTMVGCGFKAANCGGARLGEARVARARFATRPMRAAAVDSGAGFAEAEGTAKERSFDASMRVPTSMARIGRQLGGGGAATLEKAGLSMQQQAQVSSPKLADGGGGGDGDEGDDDDYFEEGDDDDGEEGFFSTRAAIGETFDRKAIQAVLSEWFKTMESLPGGIRMAVEMGIVP